MSQVALIGLSTLPSVAAGDDLCALILQAAAAQAVTLRSGDVLVVAQKIVSKAEGRCVALRDVIPSQRARELAVRCEKDPRLVALVLRESREVLRVLPGALIVVHQRGWILANAGIDQSNLPDNLQGDWALLLPEDPDHSAAQLREAIRLRTGLSLGVVINDSFGRPWRQGVVGTALGVAGWPALVDARGRPDRYGRILSNTLIGHADELAAAASLLQGQGAEGVPAVIVRGLVAPGRPGSARDLLRPAGQDLFR